METAKAKNGRKLNKLKSGVVRGKSDFFRTARYGLTLQEHRIIYYAILHGQQNATPFEPVTLAMKDFKELCDLKGNSHYSTVKKLSKKLTSKIVEVAYKDKDGYHLTQAPWLMGITYHAKTGTITITPNKILQPFFEGKPFTDTEFYFLIKFTSQYAERLYELIKATSHIKPLIDFDIDDLRKRLAVGEKQYKNYTDLKRFVLLPAISDINEYTDLEVTIDEERGLYNRVEKVYFSVTKKNVPKLSDRVANGEFQPPLTEAEQEEFMAELTDTPTPSNEFEVECDE